ncbi:hypothetical protein, partial [Actinomadura geliboluensis]|uniref:hypothetical protein n=1 Tax=Actinomadura geliboluensis TaxID=882440 RepID=UPI0026213D6A
IAGAGYEVVYKGTLLVFAGMPVYAWLKYREHRVQEEEAEAEIEVAVEEAEEYGPAPGPSEPSGPSGRSGKPGPSEPPVHAV